MSQRIFFSFHFDNEPWRANLVISSWEKKPEREARGYSIPANYERLKKGEDAEIKKWIDEQLEGTSVTVVLIGSESFNRPYCKYAIEKSFERGNGMVGIYLHKIKDKNGNVSPRGSNKFGVIGMDKNNNPVFFSFSYPTYDWVDDNGFLKLNDWIEEATKKIEDKALTAAVL
ncbi:MAG: TIR-like domain-containing protein [Bacteroidales bacterium]|nr:MAG: TIR-like domain-containing protein [Bacteroidales bacterium]